MGGTAVLGQDQHVYLLFAEEMEELINAPVLVIVLVHLFNVKEHARAEAQVVLAVALEALEVDQEATEVVQEAVAHLVVAQEAQVVLAVALEALEVVQEALEVDQEALEVDQ